MNAQMWIYTFVQMHKQINKQTQTQWQQRFPTSISSNNVVRN